MTAVHEIPLRSVKANPEAASSDKDLNGALDELYVAPFESFVAFRSELAARLRAAGDAFAARQVANATKPTRTAWALNQVARLRPELVAAIVSSREAAASAQKSGNSSEIRGSSRRHRDAIVEVVRAVGTILAADGASFSAVQARRVGETLQAIAMDETERKALTAGRLTRDVAVADPFAGIDAGPPMLRRSPGDSAPSEKSARAEASKGRLEERSAQARDAERIRRERERVTEEARSRVKTLDASIAEARKAAAQAQRELVRAQHEADQAKRTLTDREQELERAKEHLMRLAEK
jgi:hypothetical protein